MATTNELYETLNNLWEEFQENHRSFTEKGNKAAGGRARKAVGEVKKLVTDYRKASVKLVGNEKDVGYEFELTAGGDILDRALNYSKKVLVHSLNKDWSTYDKTICENYMEEKNKVMIHTGSLKILKGFQNLYNLSNDQISEGFETLQNYGNLTGVSIPTILDKSIKNGFSGKGLLIGITMGFGLDLVEIEK